MQNDSISKVIGFNFPGDDVPDDYTRMIFTFGNEVVHQKDFDSYDLFHSAIGFDGEIKGLSRTKGKYLTPVNAIFRVGKIKTENSCDECYFYLLTAIKNDR